MSCKHHCDDDHEGDAALHALGALAPAAALAHEAHLAACRACRDGAAALAATAAELALVAPAAPAPPGLKARILSRIAEAAITAPAGTPVQTWKEWRPEERDRRPCLRAEEGPWEPTGCPGIEVRRLFLDPARDRVTMLVRMAPGAAYPAHRHGGDEECYVLSGDLRVGPDLVMRAGDFQRVPDGSRHPVQSTEGGCLLYLSSSLSDELLPEVTA